MADLQENPYATTFPTEIWLNVGDCDAAECAPFKELSEITWCWESIDSMDVHYIRADLVAAKDARIAELERQLAEKLNLPAGEPLESVKLVGEKLVRTANLMGVVLTITQRPLKPLAQGNYETVVDVRPARVMADPNAPGKCAVTSCTNPCSPPAGLCKRCIDLMGD